MMPSDWRDDYLSSLRESERNNPVNKPLVEACSHLADRVAALEAEKALLQKQNPQTGSPSPGTTAAGVTGPDTTAANPSESRDVAQLKFDLAEALRSKGQLQSRIRNAEDELQKLRRTSKGDSKRISDLTSERNSLASKLRDRNEELTEKTKLVKQVQDENLTLELQINMVEQRSSKLTVENKELIDRWMKRMGEEADAMNLGNERAPR